MSGQLDEKDLNGIKQNVLVHLRQELVDNVDPRRYMTFLRSKYVLDERDCDVIKSTPSRHASAEKFFDLLAKKGSSGYDEFCNALLYDKTQVFLLTSMNTTLQILKAKTKNLKKAKADQKKHPHPRPHPQWQGYHFNAHIHPAGLRAGAPGYGPPHLHHQGHGGPGHHIPARRVRSRSPVPPEEEYMLPPTMPPPAPHDHLLHPTLPPYVATVSPHTESKLPPYDPPHDPNPAPYDPSLPPQDAVSLNHEPALPQHDITYTSAVDEEDTEDTDQPCGESTAPVSQK